MSANTRRVTIHTKATETERVNEMEQLHTTVIDYGNGIYGIDQQMVRAFLLVGTDAALLLDTGAIRADIPAIVQGITDLPLTVILTHGDGDHIGNLQDFGEAWMNERDMTAVKSHAHCERVKLRPLADGQVFDIGGRTLRVLFTPGHTAGSVCLIDDEHKILFAGDTVSYGPVFMFGERRDMAAYLSTLERLRQMKDDGVFDTVYGCHNTCPIPADATDDLIACVSGIIDKSIPGVPAPMPIPSDDKPLLGKFGNCMVLFSD